MVNKNNRPPNDAGKGGDSKGVRVASYIPPIEAQDMRDLGNKSDNKHDLRIKQDSVEALSCMELSVTPGTLYWCISSYFVIKAVEDIIRVL